MINSEEDPASALVEQALEKSTDPLPPETLAFLAEGRSRFKSVDCFHFVPSNLLFRLLLAEQNGGNGATLSQNCFPQCAPTDLPRAERYSLQNSASMKAILAKFGEDLL